MATVLSPSAGIAIKASLGGVRGSKLATTKIKLSPLQRSSIFALLLHGFLLLLLILKLNQPDPPLPALKQATVIELQFSPEMPRSSAPATPAVKASTAKELPKSDLPPSPHATERRAPKAMPKIVPLLPSAPTSALQTPSLPQLAPSNEPVSDSANAVAQLPVKYLLAVRSLIKMFMIYPLSARDTHQQGRTIIRMHLRRDGGLIEATIFKSSGAPALDEAARAEMYRISRFPILPDEFLPGSLEFFINQPVEWRLD